MKKKICFCLLFILLLISILINEHKINLSENIYESTKTNNDKYLQEKNIKYENYNFKLGEKKAPIYGIIEVKKFVSLMIDKYTNLYFENEFKENIHNLYENDKNIVNIFKLILINNSFTKSEFGEEQAYSRIFAIRGLKDIALKYDKNPLIDTILQVQNNLLEKNYDSNGEMADLKDLIRAYISLFEGENFSTNIEYHLNILGFNKEKINSSIYDIYEDEVYFYLYKNIGKEKAVSIMKKYFN